ncbi:MAG: hypothetical protein RIG61_06490 [Deltaproteobacteria bacterium]
MKEGAIKEIHISEIDAFLAERLIEAGGGALGFNVSKKDSQGNISIESLGKAEGSPGEESVDFELSPGESLNPEEADVGHYTGRPVDTSSAYEFFDFLLANLSSFDCIAEFTGNAWRIKIEDPASPTDIGHN